MVTIREYLDLKGRSPFAKWFESLNAPAAAKVTTALVRMEQGNFSKSKGVGAGIYECRIDFGPGYRIYFKTPERRHSDCPKVLDRLQGTQSQGDITKCP